VEDLILVAEVGIERTPALLRSVGNIVHRRVGEPNPSEELPSHLDHEVFCLDNSSHALLSLYPYLYIIYGVLREGIPL